jgi:hypothetical protein
MPAGALYARYVPPKAANKPAKPEVIVETVIERSANKQQDSPSHKRKRDDKSEKKAKRKSSNLAVDDTCIVTTEESNATLEAVDLEPRAQAPSDATISTADDSQPAKPVKRVKRQKTMVSDGSTAEGTVDAAEDVGMAKRHPGVFAKFQKSLNATTEAAEQDHDDDTEMADDAEQPILHGEND